MSLRVQSGTARGRILPAVPARYEVRPILHRIRKSLFDILRPRLADAPFLDLFAGTGLVGIEALSNGASRAVFVDARGDSLAMVKKNLVHLGFDGRAETIKADVTQGLRLLAGRAFKTIFMGPPYKDDKGAPLALSVPALAHVADLGLAAPDAWVVVQHHEKESLQGAEARWDMFRQKEYGDTLLSFFTPKPIVKGSSHAV